MGLGLSLAISGIGFWGAAAFLRVLSLLGSGVLVEPEMPGNTGAGSNGTELMDDVARDEVDVVVSQLEAGVTNAFTSKLVQFGFLNPLSALQGKG